MLYRALFTLYLLSLSYSLQAVSVPHWEFGLGLGLITYPDYHGSDQQRILPVPVPLFIYRGNRYFKYDDEGARGSLYLSRRLSLDWSGGAGPPTRSDNKARKGMTSLDPAIELGLELEAHLLKHGDHRLDFELAHRWITTFGKKYISAGRGRLVAAPLVYEYLLAERYDRYIKWIGKVGPIWGSAKNHHYYYGVAEREEAEGREAYSPSAGYAGMGYLAFLSWRKDDIWASIFVKYEDLRGAVFENSPLVKTKDYFAAGFFMAYLFSASKNTFEVPASTEQ